MTGAPPAWQAIEHWAARTAAFELAIWSEGADRWTWTIYDRASRVWAWDGAVTWTQADGGAPAALAGGLRAFEGRARKMGLPVEHLLDAGQLVDRLADVRRHESRNQRQIIALRLASPKRAGPGGLIADQADAAHLPLFIAANEPRLF